MTTFGQTKSNSGIDALHYDFRLTVPDSGDSIEGRAQIVAQYSPTYPLIRLDLVGPTVDSVTMHSQLCGWRREAGSLLIDLPERTGHLRDTATVVVYYHGSVSDGLIIRPDRKGRWTAFGDNWPERARYWLPCIDRPDDKATVRWEVTTFDGRQVVANGLFVKQTHVIAADGRIRTVTVWQESRPISTYLMVIAVAPFVRHDLPESPLVPQTVYVAPEDTGFLPGPFTYAPDILKFFTSILGPFPYEKLAHVASATRFGGMENASAIFYPSEAFGTRSLRPQVIAHETAHQWFGDEVTESTWAHLWLSEGFATYLEQLWIRHAIGDSAFRMELQRTRNEIIRSSITAVRPVIDSVEQKPFNLLNTNSYQKGGWILHMLRRLVGDSAFVGTLRSYLSHHAHRHAETDDLETEFEKCTHQHLRWFFDQWLRRPGYPTIETRWQFDEHQRAVLFSVSQTNQYAAFRFPLIVESIEQDGTRFRDTLQIVREGTMTFTLPHPFGKSPAAIHVDPDVDLLARIIAN